MRITFIIGNGFDIHIGLKSRYTDFYPYFKANASIDNIISNWMKKDNTLWSDMELSLGRSLEKLNLEEKERFYESREELEDLLCMYLEAEQEKFQVRGKEEKYLEEFIRSIDSFSNGLSPADKNKVNALMNASGAESFEYTPISLNYTNCLDKVVKLAQKEKPFRSHLYRGHKILDNISGVFHAHGSIEDGIIMGVSNKSQINNNELCEDSVFLSVFLKARLNDGVGQLRNEQIASYINSSMIIAIYGASMGETDSYLWEQIYRRMVVNPNVLLIFYHYEDGHKTKRPNLQRKIMRSNAIRDTFIDRVKSVGAPSDIESVKERILISYNNDLFSFNIDDK